jgi:hypothetical protein
MQLQQQCWEMLSAMAAAWMQTMSIITHHWCTATCTEHTVQGKQLWMNCDVDELLMNCDVDGLAAAQSSCMHDILLLHPPAETTG